MSLEIFTKRIDCLRIIVNVLFNEVYGSAYKLAVSLIEKLSMDLQGSMCPTIYCEKSLIRRDLKG